MVLAVSIWKSLSRGTLTSRTSFIAADTSYIPYVGEKVSALSDPGLQKILKQRSIISSLPFPRKIEFTGTFFILLMPSLSFLW